MVSCKFEDLLILDLHSNNGFFNHQNESDLVALVQVMIIIFGEQPPVYSVAGQPPTNPTAVYPGSLAGMSMAIHLNSLTGINKWFSGYPPYPTSATAYPPATPYPPYPPVNGPASTYPSYSGGYPPYPPAPGSVTNSAYPPYPTPVSVTNAQSTGTISEDHIRASLLSAVEDKVTNIHQIALHKMF
jgi:ESCRT-I complex subunit TSG101